MNRRHFIGALAGIFSGSIAAKSLFAGEIYTPQRGDPLRKKLLDVIRPRVEAELGRPVIFVVTVLNVQADWAFLNVEPVNRDGSPIDIYQTRYARKADMMDGLTNFALLHYKNNRWNEVVHLVGPTDVGYIPWADDFGVSRSLLNLE
jgi:hypothetical protein